MESIIGNITQKLYKKHLLIVGGDKTQRQKLIDEIITQANLDFFCFPIGMKTIDKYIDFVRKENMYQAWYSKKGKFGSNQILDFHRDWILENNSLVILREFQEMEQSWKMDIIGTYIEQIENKKKGEKAIKLIISQEDENNLIEDLTREIYIKDGERRTKSQIIEGNIEVIEV